MKNPYKYICKSLNKILVSCTQKYRERNLYKWKKFIQKYKAASIFESHVNKTVQKETHINMTRRFSLEQGKDKLMKKSIFLMLWKQIYSHV